MTSAKNPESKPLFLSAWAAEWEFAGKRLGMLHFISRSLLAS